MAVDQWQDRVEALEGKVTGLQSQLDLRTKELAYLYIHSNWTLIRWYLARDQDQSGQGSETYARAKNAETLIFALNTGPMTCGLETAATEARGRN